MLQCEESASALLVQGEITLYSGKSGFVALMRMTRPQIALQIQGLPLIFQNEIHAPFWRCIGNLGSYMLWFCFEIQQSARNEIFRPAQKRHGLRLWERQKKEGRHRFKTLCHHFPRGVIKIAMFNPRNALKILPLSSVYSSAFIFRVASGISWYWSNAIKTINLSS